MMIVQRLMCSRLLLAILFILMILWGKGQSVLSSGDWYKVGVTETGIYKLDRDFLGSLGINVNNLDPRTLKVYGNGGGGMLPQSNSEPRAFDLLQNAIWGSGESDGIFSQEDYFLFYGRSPNRVEWTTKGMTYEKNLYSDTTYYFITWGGDQGLRIDSQANLTEQVEKITSYDDVIIHELDENNLLASGRRWFGEALSQATGLTKEFNYQRDNVISYEQVDLLAMAQSEGDCSLAISINGSEVGAIDLDAVPFGSNSTYQIKGSESFGEFSVIGNSDVIEIELDFSPNGSTSIAYLDWFGLTMKRELIIEDAPLYFRSIESVSNSISSFQIENANENLKIWDVSNPVIPASLEYSISNNQAIFSTPSVEVKEFVAFSGNNFPRPYEFGLVKNQSIQSITDVDGIIITHPLFKKSAKRLANFHEANDNLNINVVTTRQVFNEFSSGMQDITAIRDYVKYVYEKSGQLKYLLLFGDASYDYKNRIINNTNFVPIYESRDSFHPIFSHSSDDYFGFMDSDEGDWIETYEGDHTTEIGIGRLPVKTTTEAELIVNKIIRYSTSSATLGKWRNQVLYVADDGDHNIHARQAEDLSEIVNVRSELNTRKIYLDAFDQQINPSNERSSSTTRAILDEIEQGSLLVNYIGHGNERFWMDEQVLTTSEIGKLTNFQKLPIFITATCEFGRYDDPFQFSGAEQLLLGEQGAIALLTTTRPVFASTNFILNEAYHESIVSMAQESKMRLGDAIRETKNNSLSGPVNRNFALLGDPMMRPAFPKFDVKLDQFLGIEPDTLSALEKVTITGGIFNNDQLVEDFEGRLHMVLFDVPTDKITKGQESIPYLYTERDNALFRGEITVVGGEFSSEFVIPKNISYQNKGGKLSFYAWDEEMNQDANGVSWNLVLGGTNKDAPEDTTSPQLEVYLNEPSFKNGSRVGSGALLVAKFSDENGINISNTGFDRGIALDLNGEIIELNDFYTADLDDYRKGTVLYPLKDLAPGRYSAKIKGGDSYNNTVEKSVEFVVSDQPILLTHNFKNFPNPAKTYTNFIFEHDREGQPLTVDMMLYAMSGNQVIKEVENIDFSNRRVELEMSFQGRVPYDGLYLYRIVVKSLVDGATDELVGRMVIRN